MWTSALAISCGICEVTDWVLEIFLDCRRLRSSMFMKSMLPPKFSWYVREQLDAAVLEQLGHDAVGDRRADLGLDVVADDRDAGGGELLRPLRRAGDEHRQRVDERDAGVDRALRVEAGGVLGPDRQVADQHVGLRAARSVATTSTGSSSDSVMISR